VIYNFLITRSYAGIELAISSSSQETNKAIFDELMHHKETIEAQYGTALSWERLDDKKMSRIAHKLQDVSIFNEEDWPKMLDFLTKQMVVFEKAMREPLKKVKRKLKA
jgi:hypothetical protein